ncbi:MAG: spiro-SPASM protein [Spirochaetaceae bacterium]|nr:spiro-SPASM protein [Spirochaetaceae bacterium]
MKRKYTAAVILFAGQLSEAALENAFDGRCAFSLALKKAASFPEALKITVLAANDFDETLLPRGIDSIELVREASWNTKNFLQALSKAGEGFGLSYFAWADCPFLDPHLAGTLAERHLRGAAEYSYADGWPSGLAPEILAPGTAGMLSFINGDTEASVDRDMIFNVLQKDINAFDIETEISPVDLRQHRLTLAARSKRDLLLLRRLWDEGIASAPSAADFVGQIIAEKPALLRTLPAFYPIQAVSACPQRCQLCPYPQSPRFVSAAPGAELSENCWLKPDDFSLLLDKIAGFSDDAVIDLSLWGELALHPQKMELVKAVLRRPSLSLVIETSGIGWKRADFETLAGEAAACAPRKNGMAALSWIVSLDTSGEAGNERGDGFGAAVEAARSVISLFPRDGYVQAVRVKGNEESIERFYRFWKAEGANVIIQKYDSFCGFLPPRSAADLSPVRRGPCWHLMRDMPVLLDGSVPVCRAASVLQPGGEAVSADTVLGNAFSEGLDEIWQRGEALYARHCAGAYDGPCSRCDEYYTFNF